MHSSPSHQAAAPMHDIFPEFTLPPFYEIALLLCLVCCVAGLNIWLRLGVGRQFAISVGRMVAQLFLCGLVLNTVFSLHGIWAIPLVIGMAAMAIYEITSRLRGKTPRKKMRTPLWPLATSAVLFGALPTALAGHILLAETAPDGTSTLWETRHILPVFGMVLGNTLTGLTIGLDSLLHSITHNKKHIEARLAMGMRRYAAFRPFITAAAYRALLPTLNNMAVVGVVFLPGMMTGQILAGAPPFQAAYAQGAILLIIACAVAMGVFLALHLAVHLSTDQRHRLK
jgi:putative ABC transport system permease protein